MIRGKHVIYNGSMSPIYICWLLFSNYSNQFDTKEEFYEKTIKELEARLKNVKFPMFLYSLN